MNPLMGFQVWALRVDFGAAGEIAVVDPSFLQFGIIASIIFNYKFEHRHTQREGSK